MMRVGRHMVVCQLFRLAFLFDVWQCLREFGIRHPGVEWLVVFPSLWVVCYVAWRVDLQVCLSFVEVLFLVVAMLLGVPFLFQYLLLAVGVEGRLLVWA